MKLVPLLICAFAVGACSSMRQADYRALVIPAPAVRDTRASVVTRISDVDPLVENGDIYEKVALALPDAVRVLYVPEGAFVRVSPGQTRRMDIYIVKDQNFGGHPGKFSSIRTLKDKMGAGIRIQGKKMYFCLYGGFDSNIEGGYGALAALMVPPGIRVVEEKHLQFDEIIGDPWNGKEHFKPADWFILPTSPDPQRNYNRFERKR